MKLLVSVSLKLFLFIAWLCFSVVVGGLVLSVKNSLGYNVFQTTGYHAFERCLVQESAKALLEKEDALSPRPTSAPATPAPAATANGKEPVQKKSSRAH